MSHTNSCAADSVIAGILAGTAVAAWFFAIDLVAGHPLSTPLSLGHAVATVLHLGAWAFVPVVTVVGYTVIHYAAFLALGAAAAALVRLVYANATVPAGLLLAFAVLECAFFSAVAALYTLTNVGDQDWLQLITGNIIGFAAIAGTLWSRHPKLGGALVRALDDTGSWRVRALDDTQSWPVPALDDKGSWPARSIDNPRSGQ